MQQTTTRSTDLEYFLKGKPLLPLLLGALLLAPASFGQLRERLRERAEKGDAEAQFELAKMYETGRGGLTKNFAEAERLYRLSAEQGDVFAQASLAILYRFGKGVPQDFVQAYVWFSIAASRATGGEYDSIAEMRDFAAAKMTAAQRAQAKRLINAWKPAPSKPVG